MISTTSKGSRRITNTLLLKSNSVDNIVIMHGDMGFP